MTTSTSSPGDFVSFLHYIILCVWRLDIDEFFFSLYRQVLVAGRGDGVVDYLRTEVRIASKILV